MVTNLGIEPLIPLLGVHVSSKCSCQIFLQLSGLALIIVGAIVKSKYGEYLTFADHKYADAAIFLICVGVIVFIIAFLGCCGAIKEHYCMVTTFAVFVVIIFILEIVAGVLGLVYKKKVRES